MKNLLLTIIAALLSASTCIAQDSSPLTMVVMDPLAKPLACDCVQGYAQRRYEVLGNYLQQNLKRPVKVVWSESLTKAVDENGEAHIVIGKHSVVLHDAEQNEHGMVALAQLTGSDGTTTQQGFVVVRSEDPAQSVEDLQGYRFLFGPEECEEKYDAPMQLLKDGGIEIAAEPETCEACSTSAAKLMDLPAETKAAAIISSYAAPLLEGCGTIKKGDLRVIGKSHAVPFITACASTSLSKEEHAAIRVALMDVELDPQVMLALETGVGFREWKPGSSSDEKKSGDKSLKKSQQ